MASNDSETSGSEDAQDTSSDYELESDMEPNFLADTLSGYLESCELFPVTDPESSKNSGARNIYKPDALVDPLNSIVLNESFVRCNDGPGPNKFREIKGSSTRRSTRKSSVNQETDINLTARKTRRTSGKKPMVDLLAADFGRGKRSNSVRRARPLSWGLGGKIYDIFKLDADSNVDAAEYLELRKEVKATHNSQDESQTLDKGLLLKLKVGTDAVYNCQVNKIPDMDKGLESYREVELEASTLQSDINCNYATEAPSTSNVILNKGILSSNPSVIVGLYAESRRRGKLAVKAVSVETKCLDPGTSPDSEVINVIPDIQISGTATEGLNDIPISSKDSISHQSGDCGVGSGITSPEIVSDVLLCDNFEHGEKHIEGSRSSGASISVTAGVASGNTSSREECPADLVRSLQETEIGVSTCMPTVESGTKADLSIAGIDSLESKNSQKLQKSSRSKSPLNEERTNFRQKELHASLTANGKNKGKNKGNNKGKNKAERVKAETDDAESHPVTGSTEMSDITGLEEGFRSTVGKETEVGVSTCMPTVESGTKADFSIAGIDSLKSKYSQKLQKSSRSKSPVNEERTNFRQKELQASLTANGKNKGKNKAESVKAETDDAENHPVTGDTEMSDITGLEEGFRSTVGKETEVGVSTCMPTVESGTKADLSIAGIDSLKSKNSQKLQKSSGSKSPVNEERTNFRQKELQASLTANGKNKGKNKADSVKAETDDAESHPVTGDTEMSDITGLEEGFRSTVKPVSHSIVVPNAWVCCDDCHKWRRISAVLADAINSTECRWTCEENMDKTFAACSIPQEKSNADINAELELSDVSGDEDASNTRLNSSQLGKKQSIDPPELPWKLIKTNMFLHRNRKNQPMDEIMVCHCKPLPDGRMGCRDQCLNRMLNIECVKGTCPCGDFCSNQQFQKRKYSKLKCVKSGKKGCGLQLQEDIPKGRFLIEYVGEVLDMPAYEARQREYALKGHRHFYFMTLNGSEVIDACAKGNLGRFINHSCEPNCRTEKWMVNGEVCVGLFAIRDIKKGEELTFDYNYVRVFGAAAKKCVCGSSRCRGVIGGDPLNSETVILGDSDDEYPEPVTIYENTLDKLDDIIISTTQTAESPVTDDVVNDRSPDEKNDDLAAPIESAERETYFGRSSCDTSVSESKIEHTNELSTSCVEPPYPSLEVNDLKSEIKQQKESITSGNLFPDDDSKRKPKSKTKLIKCPIIKPKSRSKLPSPSSAMKKGKFKNKQPEIDNKPPEVPQKPKKIVVDNLTGSFEAVEEALNTLLSKGGISKRRDASKGYLTLLCLTANGGNGEGIQSNRDLSMILDALLRTKSRTVLLDIINKNGLQMLHILLKRYKKVFSRTPILRKLLKVIEFLAETKILTLDNILRPSLPGVESFKESMLSLTEHADREVHRMARRFRDRHIPWSARRVNRAELDTERIDSQQNSKSKRISSQHSRDRRPFEDVDNSTDPRILEGSSASCPTSTSTDQTRIRKRKSRWDESADVGPEFESPPRKELRSTNHEHVDMDVDREAPPGFSSPPVKRQLLFQPNPSTDNHRCKPVMGQPQDRYNSRLPTSFGIPCSVFRKIGTREPNSAAAESWVVAPAMTFHPFPPLPKYPRDENPMNLHVKEQPWRNPNFNQPGFHRDRNANTLGRRYFKQQKWNNSRPGHQWNPNKYGPAGFNQNQLNAGVGYGGNENYGNGFYQQPHY